MLGYLTEGFLISKHALKIKIHVRSAVFEIIFQYSLNIADTKKKHWRNDIKFNFVSACSHRNSTLYIF